MNYFLEIRLCGFSSPGPKAQLSFSDLVRCLSLSLSVVVVVVGVVGAVVVVNISHFHLLLTGPILTKLGEEHSWEEGIQVYSNGGPRSRG